MCPKGIIKKHVHRNTDCTGLVCKHKKMYMDVYTALGSFEFVTLHIGRVLHVHVHMRIRMADQNKSIKFETGQIYHQYSK